MLKLSWIRWGLDDFGKGTTPSSNCKRNISFNNSFIKSNSYQISQHHLGGGLSVFISNGLHLGIIDIIGCPCGRITSAQRAIASHHNIILLAEFDELRLYESGIALDLENIF